MNLFKDGKSQRRYFHKKNTQREADNVTEEVVHEKLFVTKVKNQEI